MYLKLESLQPTFSFKIRGAWNAVLALGERRDSRDIVTASAGNHGRGLASAAQAQGLKLTVYVPATAPRIKVDAIRAAGASVRECKNYDEAERLAKGAARESGAIYIAPYSDPDVIAGAGTIGLEILEDLPSAGTIVVPVGGGGLISGIALAAQGRAAVVGVEAEASSPFTHSLAAGRIVPIEVQPTLADGLAGNLDPETITFDIVRRLVSRIELVSETEIRSAIRHVVLEERLIVEAAAAVAVAAIVWRRVTASGADRPIAAVLSGANIDPEKLRELI